MSSELSEKVYPTQLPKVPELTPVFIINVKAGEFNPALSSKLLGKDIMYVPVINGTIKSLENKFGYKFEASGLSGHDKITVTHDHGQHLDCILAGKTPNGSPVFFHYPGLGMPNEKLAAFQSGESDVADFDDFYLYSNPEFELSDSVEEEYKWVSSKRFLAKGRFIKDESGVYVQYVVYVVD